MKKVSRNLLLTSSVLVTPLIIAPIVSCSNEKKLPKGENYRNVETGLLFRIDSKGEAYITGWESDEKELTIPKNIEFNSVLSSEHYGYKAKVVGIDGEAFQNTNLIKVNIPNSVTWIGDSAFRDTPLTQVTIPDSVASIGWYAFKNTQLTQVTIPNSVTSLGWYAFENTQLTQVTIPNLVTEIGASTFENTPLTKVTIPDSVAKIWSSAFANTNIKEVTLPANCEYYSISFPKSTTITGGKLVS